MQNNGKKFQPNMSQGKTPEEMNETGVEVYKVYTAPCIFLSFLFIWPSPVHTLMQYCLELNGLIKHFFLRFKHSHSDPIIKSAYTFFIFIFFACLSCRELPSLSGLLSFRKSLTLIKAD